MVSYIRHDLEFILKQIKIAEAHAAGQPLYGEGGLIPAYNVAWGLRTVDGSYNHLLPGQEQWGAAGRAFPEQLTPVYRPADGTPFDPDGPGPAPAMPTAPNYNPSNNANSLVFDSSLRTISNLLVDQTLGNPAAVLTALARAGSANPMSDLPKVTAIYQAFKPASDAEYQARVVMQNAKSKAEALGDGDSSTPPSPAEQAALDALADATAAHNVAVVALEAARVVRDEKLAPFGIEMDGDNVSLPAVAPDEGLSAPFNSWFTLFGQFFDHGLDLINKGGSGTVFIPLKPDDPLYVEGSHTNFMVLTRATVSAGQDGVMGTADDVRPVNTTTAYVDQNQTYSSHASHQVFLRQYEVVDDKPVATGRLIEGANGGMATWGEVKAQAKMLGIELTDNDVGNVPLLRTDQYGNFIPNADGYAQVIVGVGADGIPNTSDDIVVSGTPGAPVNPTTAGAIRTGHAFLADIAHEAVPIGKIADGDITIGLGNPGNGDAEYDNELLDAHFIAGDGRVNENIGLTAVHHVFHAEHNRLVEHTKEVVLADAAAMLQAGASQAEAVAFLNEWLAVDVTTVPASGVGLVWDGERLFQAAKFGTEMQYQHLVFEEFARKVQPSINVFLVPDGFDTTINPDIVAEFAHVVYRFGHSMLTESIDRFSPNFTADHIGLVEGFLNPVKFDSGHTIDDGIAAGAIVRGMTRQVGNEIDEFVTTALRNNLLGLPLDLATINLARGRDTGVPSLNEARREFYEATNQNILLKPYESWTDFAGHLKNEASIINFVAAYGTHSLITGETTVEGKRDAALTLITGFATGKFAGNPNFVVPADRLDFLNATGSYAGGSLGGLENVDLWIGGLAEEIMPFGGMLGSTFNFVFEVQMEKLQNADRFYYLQRLDGLHLFGEMENNSFAAMIMRNTDATHLPSDVFSTPGLFLEVDQTKQFNDLDGNGTLESTDPAGGSLLTPLVIRDNPLTAAVETNYLRYTGGEHVVMGGTNANDTIIASDGDDTLYGDGGNDRLEGDFGNDIINGGDGDDIILDSGGDDNIKAGAGNDVVHAGPGLDLVMGGAGQDFIFLGTDMGSEVFAGEGNDFIYGNRNAERILGNEGDDWIETGTFDGAPGDNFDEVFAQDEIDGNDVFLGDGGFDEFIGEGGDDIMVGSAGRGKMAGMSGFDWATYKDNTLGVNADLSRPIVFDENPTLPQNAALDEYASMEGLSGSRFNDTLSGSDAVAADRLPASQGGTEGFAGSALDAAGIALIKGLQEVLGAGVTSFSAGDIILGGDGSDVIRGNGGDDIIDGDKWLDVQIGVYNLDANGKRVGEPIALHNSMTTLAAKMFDGTINPGQLAIVRTIRTDTTAGDVDVAAFSGVRADYDITLNANGTVSVVHARGTQTDGTDTLRNIERLRFSDMEIVVPIPPTDIQWNGVTPDDGIAGFGDLANGLPSAGSVIANLATTDADTNSGFVYALAAGSSPGFAVSPAGVVTRIGTGMASNTTYTLNISSTDTTGATRTETFTITTGTNSTFLTSGANNLTAGNTDSVFYGSGGNDTLTGGNGNDNLFGQSGNDILNGGSGNDNLAGGSGNDIINGGSGNDTIVVDIDDDPNENDVISGGADIDTLSIIDTGAGGETLTVAYNGTRITQIEGSGSIAADVEAVNADLGAGADTLSYAGSTASVTVNLGTGQASGFGSISSIENVTGGSGADNLTGDAIGNSLNGGAGNDTVNGGDGVDTLNGGSGNDTVNGGDGNDFIDQVSNEGRDFIDGGVGADTYRLSGVGGPEVFRIYTRAAAVTAGLTGLGETTEIVVTRNTNGPGGAVTNANIIAELDNIEEISVNFLNTTANNGNNPNQPDGGSSNGDTIQVIGNFNGTSLNFSTITVDGHAGDDTVDITSLQSAHRIVFKSNGGNDTIVGTLRDQDVIELAPGLDVDDYAKIVNANGTVTWKSATHSVTYASNGNPILKKHEKDDDGDDETADNQDPVVTGEHFTIKKGEALTLTVAQLLANDVDPDGGTLSLVDIDEDEHGKAVLNPDGTITFKPKAGFTGEASFSYTVADGQGGATEGTVTIMVEKPAPVSLTGGRGHDRLYGDDANDRLKGRDGHDRLDGGDGADKMWGGRGNDTYIVDDRGDRVYEGRSHGIDTVKASVSYSLSGTHVEKLVLTGSEDLNGTGNRLDNTLTGNAGENVLKGKSGDDVLKGKGGDDRLYGGSGEDKLHGGSGDDRLDGGSGNDTLYGNSGQDVFVFGKGSGWDTVADFRSGQDKVDVSNLSGVKSTSDLNMSQVGEDAVILHGSDILVLKGVQASDLDGNDFIF